MLSLSVEDRPVDPELARAVEGAAHPTRIYACIADGWRVQTCTLDGVDVTKVAAWADPVKNEAGIYPYVVVDGSVRLTAEAPVATPGKAELTFAD